MPTRCNIQDTTAISCGLRPADKSGPSLYNKKIDAQPKFQVRQVQVSPGGGVPPDPRPGQCF